MVRLFLVRWEGLLKVNREDVLEPIVLASGSLRRKEYFKLLGLPFSIMPPEIDEKNTGFLPPRQFVEDIAKRKVLRVIEQLAGRLPMWVCAADTLIALDGETLGKPADRDAAYRTLKRLAGREHEVISAVALYKGKSGLRPSVLDCRSVVSVVSFAAMTEPELEWYLDTGEWQGAAGAYKIQGLGACFVREVRGSYSSIVGLPLYEFRAMLIENGYPYMQDVGA
jgi:septum formation protein